MDVEQQVERVFQSYGEPDGGLPDVHLLQLPFGEESEDGRGGVDGQRAAVEQIRGPMDELQPVQETENIIIR